MEQHSATNRLKQEQFWPTSVEFRIQLKKRNKIQDSHLTILGKWDSAICSVTDRLKQEQFL